MARIGNGKGKGRVIPAVLAAAGLALGLPGAGLAVSGSNAQQASAKAIAGLPFTPANVDPGLALKVASVLGNEGLRFTPASNPGRDRDRTVTVAVRVDRATARAISIRQPLESVGGEARPVILAATRYNLGIARGYQSFVQPSRTPVMPEGLRDVAMPDLSTYRPEDAKRGKPSRFGSRIALEQGQRSGRTAGSFDALEEQSIEVQGSYRVMRNLDVTAGVRLSQERDRLAPLTDGVEDDKSVYVGTQIRF